MSAILKFDFRKKKTITFFWSKLSKLHKKDPILHVRTTFSLKQGEARTSSGPIPHPLTLHANDKLFLNFDSKRFMVQLTPLHIGCNLEKLSDVAKCKIEFMVSF